MGVADQLVKFDPRYRNVFSNLLGRVVVMEDLDAAIAAARNLPASNYPRCQLCAENEGYAGRVNHPARQNHRIVPITINGSPWFLQYSPYVYYNEHCICLNREHVPMKIDRACFAKLLDFVGQFPHYFVGSGNQWGATYSYSICYCEEQMWIRTKSITCPEFFHGMQEILVADTPVTLFMGEDEQRPLAERVARFLPKVCGNYTVIDTKELPMEGISPEFRGSLSHLMMHAVNNRVDAYMELFLRHPLSIRRYYRQFDY